MIAQPPTQKNNEWYTPSKYIEAARLVMGGIDLDPASCEMANQTVKAARYYSIEDNGLALPWSGRVWCNPPFSQTPDCMAPLPTWSKKIIYEYESGNVEQAIFLAKAETKNPWFHKLFAYPVCLSVHRIKFLRPGREPQEIREGVAFIYLGPNEDKFVEVFSQFGTIAKRVSSPKRQVSLSLWETTN